MFKAYNASAGSGKTTNLVIEYLSLCFLNIQNYRHILAITFTNNATAEMKERIIQYLELFAFTQKEQFTSNSDKILYEQVIAKCKSKIPKLANEKEAEKFMQEQSQELLKKILYDYNNFSISTIDSFFQRILRAFAYDLHLNLNYNVEINLEELFTQATDLLLNKISKQEKELSERVIGIVNKQLEESGKWKVEKTLTDILEETYKETSYIPIRKLQELEPSEFHKACQDFKDKRNKRLTELKSQALTTAKETDTLIQSIGDVSEFTQGKNGIYYWFSKVQQKFPDVAANSYIENCIKTGSFTKKGIDANHFDTILQSLEKIQAYGFETQKLKCLGSEIEKLILLFDLKNIMDDIKLRDNLFFLSESNAKIYEEIKDEEAPYIYEKIGTKYKYFFIDEFQDTSKMQWENLLPLIKNALASGGETIIFGDLKQAIYRFRGGDKDLFDNLSDEDKFTNQNIPTPFERISLKHNHRSSRSIIEFNNRCFKQLGPQYAFYNEIQDIDKDNTVTGFVQINFMPQDSTKEDFLISTILNNVSDALSRGFEYKDIAILTKGRDLGNIIAQHLSSAGHPVISSDSLLLSSSPEVMLLINTLQYLNDPDDKLSQLNIWNYLHVLKKEVNSLNEGITEIANDHFPQHIKQTFDIDYDKQKLTSLPLYTLVKEIMLIYNITENNSYVIRFLDTLLEYSNKKDNDLSQFLIWWKTKEKKLSIVSSKDDNAITVTTIHQAKGLGYPVVIIPIIRYKETQSTSLWYPTQKNDLTSLPYLPVKYQKTMSDIAAFQNIYQTEASNFEIDNWNTIYVAQTRAREAMYIITDKRNSKKNYAYFLSNCLNQIGNDITNLTSDVLIYGDQAYQHSTKRKNNSDTNVSISKVYLNNFTPKQLLKKGTSPTKQQERGIAIHDYLASLKSFPKNEAEIEALDIKLNAEYIPAAKKIIQQITQDESIKPYLSDETEVLNEINIIDKNGQVHRPDRVMILHNNVLILDYKTGQAKEEYTSQINTYISLIREMGYENVEGKLIYIDND